MKSIGLFSGAGGFELGFEQVGIKTVAQCDLYNPQEIPELAEDYERRLEASRFDCLPAKCP